MYYSWYGRTDITHVLTVWSAGRILIPLASEVRKMCMRHFPAFAAEQVDYSRGFVEWPTPEYEKSGDIVDVLRKNGALK